MNNRQTIFYRVATAALYIFFRALVEKKVYTMKAKLRINNKCKEESCNSS